MGLFKKKSSRGSMPKGFDKSKPRNDKEDSKNVPNSGINYRNSFVGVFKKKPSLGAGGSMPKGFDKSKPRYDKQDFNEQENSRITDSNHSNGIISNPYSMYDDRIQEIDKTISEYREMIADERKLIKKNQPGFLDYALGGMKTYADLSSFDNSRSHDLIIQIESEIIRLENEKASYIEKKRKSSFEDISTQVSAPPIGYATNSSDEILDDLSQNELEKLIEEQKSDFKKMREINEGMIEMTKNIAEKNNENDDPLKILKIRYAKGEITKEEFKQMKKDLS